MRISDWSSDVCSSDLDRTLEHLRQQSRRRLVAPGVVINLETLDEVLGRRFEGMAWIDGELLQAAGLCKTVRMQQEQCSVVQIVRASCRERVCQYVSISVVAVVFINKECILKMS